jgi:hypothetical protein
MPWSNLVMRHSTLVLWIVASGIAILGLMSLAIVGAVIYSSLKYGKPPEILSNWGGLIIGFFIGSFFNFARTALGVEARPDARDL